MKAKKLPSGNWRCLTYLGEKDGKQIRKSFTAPTKKEAEFLAMQYVSEYEKSQSDDCTVADAIDRYIASRESVLSPSTIREYRRSQRSDFEPIKDFSVQSITSEQIQVFINALSISKAPKTVKNVYGLLRASLTAINPSKVYFITLPQTKPTEYHIPTDADVKNMLDVADPVMKIAIIFAAVGTMRRGEICALDYSDIHGNSIHVHADMVLDPNNKYIIKSIPKTSKSDRYITFSNAVMEQIGHGEGRIVPITPRRLSKRFDKIKKKCHIKCRFHDLRHYAASIMHALGIPDQYIMERGGWSSDATLKAVYRNTLSDKQKEFSDKANDYLDKLL